MRSTSYTLLCSFFAVAPKGMPSHLYTETLALLYMGALISTPNGFDLLTYPVSSHWASSGLNLDLLQLLAP